MSVEKQEEVSPTTVSSNQNTTCHVTASDQYTPEEAAVAVASELPYEIVESYSSDSSSLLIENTRNLGLKSSIKEWFDCMSVDERLAALGFFDGEFLAAFFAMVKSTDARIRPANADLARNINWEASIQIKGFKHAYIKCKKDGIIPPLDVLSSSDADSSENCLDADVFRIGNTTATATAPSPALASLLNSVCIVLPAAWKHEANISFAGQAPFVVASPAYMEHTSCEELFLALESSTMGNTTIEYFLVATVETDCLPHWLRRIDEPSSNELPLSTIFVERLKDQLVTAFRSRHMKPVCVPGISQWTAQETSENTQSPLSSLKQETGDIAVESLISTVRAKSVALREKSLSINSSVIASSMGPLVDFVAQTETLNSDSPPCEELLFLPIDRLSLTKMPINFTLLNEAIELCLERFSAFTDVAGPPTSLPVSAVSLSTATLQSSELSRIELSISRDTFFSREESYPDFSPPVQEHLPSQLKGKKKKKKKKQRNRKHSIDDPTPAPSLISTPIVKDAAYYSAVDIPEVISRTNSDLSEIWIEAETQKPMVQFADFNAKVTEPTLSGEANSSSAEASTLNTTLDLSVSVDVMIAPLPATHEPEMISKELTEPVEVKDMKGSELDDVWETVEVRGRNSRKKPQSTWLHQHTTAIHHFGMVGSPGEYGHGPRKNKSVRTPVTRKRNGNRKLAREIMISVLDAVDDEVNQRERMKLQQIKNQQRIKQQVPSIASVVKSSTPNPWNNGPPLLSEIIPKIHVPQPKASLSTPPLPVKTSAVVETEKKPVSLRDVVLGRHILPSPQTPPLPTQQTRATPTLGMKYLETARSPSSGKSPLSRSKGNLASGFDQNTAPTYQETASSNSNAVTAVKSSLITSSGERVSKNGSSSVESEEAPPSLHRAPLSPDINQSPAVPPLPTLLRAENANSANSSVASSLEVPHISRRLHTHHHDSLVDVNDVGYHLLDVCDRLSRDMSLFMSRRALALNARRKERGVLLSALQSTVASLWPYRGHVEMYGSCATELDLPSSDLDVVIVGLDCSFSGSTTGQRDSVASVSSLSQDDILRSQSEDSSAAVVSQDAVTPHIPVLNGTVPLGAYPLMHLPKNSERVVRLAAALETQSWAVQVKSIPTATVPVIKVLADPSKLVCVSSSGAWSAAPEGSKVSHQDRVQPYQPLWRGADVMNGLLKLDITFEGPEHGGIGSTQLSAQIVAETCHESGLYPEETPLVQVVMVLKEILAQRKLNEPYSGGLSSYALILLVVAVLRERIVIREEIQRAERQMEAMASGENASRFIPPLHPTSSDAEWLEVDIKPVTSTSSTNDALPNAPRAESATHSVVRGSVSNKSSNSSWASIAKLNINDTKEPKVFVKPSNDSSNSRSTNVLSKPSLADTFFPSTSLGRSSSQQTRLALKSSATETTTSFDGEYNQESVQEQLATGGMTAPPDGCAIHSSRNGGVSTSSPSLTTDASIRPSFFPQVYNDAMEVLCAGETNAGKLLMHFLLYYGQHFDAQTTAIDISGKHERDFSGHSSPYSYYSPYIVRRSAGNIDPVTGMLTIDPLVIYDPIEGAENNNVARRCFAWSSVRWVFAQSYATLSSAVERSATPPWTPGGDIKSANATMDALQAISFPSPEWNFDVNDPSSPLLRCLLSF